MASGEYRVEEGTTVLDLLKTCESASEASIPEKSYKHMCYLFNGKPLTLDSAIKESGTLHLCRIAVGG